MSCTSCQKSSFYNSYPSSNGDNYMKTPTNFYVPQIPQNYTVPQFSSNYVKTSSISSIYPIAQPEIKFSYSPINQTPDCGFSYQAPLKCPPIVSQPICKQPIYHAPLPLPTLPISQPCGNPIYQTPLPIPQSQQIQSIKAIQIASRDFMIILDEDGGVWTNFEETSSCNSTQSLTKLQLPEPVSYVTIGGALDSKLNFGVALGISNKLYFIGNMSRAQKYIPIYDPTSIAGTIISMAAGKGFVALLNDSGNLYGFGPAFGVKSCGNQIVILSLGTGVAIPTDILYQNTIAATNSMIYAIDSSTGNIFVKSINGSTQSSWSSPGITYIAVYGGYDSYGAIDSNGIFWVGGNNSQGQLGLGTTTSPVGGFTPLTITSQSNPGKSISFGLNHSLFLLTDGSVYGSGSNSHGQLGYSNRVTSIGNGIVSTNTPILLLFTGVSFASAGSNFSAFIYKGAVFVVGHIPGHLSSTPWFPRVLIPFCPNLNPCSKCVKSGCVSTSCECFKISFVSWLASL